MFTAADFATLAPNPDAVVFYGTLQCMHSARADPFAIVCNAMADDELIPGWTDRKRYMRARDFLLSHGFLDLMHKGGARPGDPSLYRLISPTQKAGSAEGGVLLSIVAESRTLNESPAEQPAQPKNYGRMPSRQPSWPASERKRAGLTQQRLADLVGIGRGYLSSIEQGLRNPSPETRAAISSAIQEHAA